MRSMMKVLVYVVEGVVFTAVIIVGAVVSVALAWRDECDRRLSDPPNVLG